MRTHKAHQTGFTMIEILVAMIILAVGLLGVAGIQTLSLKSSVNSNARSLVNIYAYDIVERMRGNMPGVEAGGYNSITGAEANPGCIPSCTVAQMATFDAYDWQQNLVAALPGATGTVSYAGGVATVTINWTERVRGNNAEAQQYVLTARILQ